MDTYLKLIEEGLINFTKKYNNTEPQIIRQAAFYSLFSGGKRIRPTLLLMSYVAVNNNNHKLPMAFAVALEMLHTYSLIHDDLPAIDNDNYRRGRPTNHKVYGEAVAILAGDTLLNMAYEVIFESIADDFCKKKVDAANVIAQAAGLKGMISGQMQDILSEKSGDITKEQLEFIHTHKTAAMIEASIVAGAILGGATDQVVLNLKKMGTLIGLAFQIKDDILDIEGSTKTLGKDANSDVKNNKATYVSLWGIEKSKQELNNLTHEGIKILDSLSLKTHELQNLVLQLLERTN